MACPRSALPSQTRAETAISEALDSLDAYASQVLVMSVIRSITKSCCAKTCKNYSSPDLTYCTDFLYYPHPTPQTSCTFQTWCSLPTSQTFWFLPDITYLQDLPFFLILSYLHHTSFTCGPQGSGQTVEEWKIHSSYLLGKLV